MAYDFQTRRSVEFADTDAAGIVHFAGYFRYMEAVEHEFFRSVGLSIYTTVDGRTITFPRVHAECDYHAPLRFEDVVELHLVVREVRTKTIAFDFFIYRLEGDEPRFAAHGSIITACVTKDGPVMKSVPIPRQVLDRIEPAPPEALQRHADRGAVRRPK